MSYSRSKSFRVAYVLTADGLRGLLNTISNLVESEDPGSLPNMSGPRFTYTVEFADGSEARTDELENILSLSNSGAKRITGLRVLAGYHVRPRVHLSFDTKWVTANVTYNVFDATDSQVLYLSSKLNDEVSRIRTWYSTIAYLDALTIALLVNGLFGLVCAGVTGVLFLARGTNPLTINVSLATLVVSSLYVAALALVSAGLYRLKPWLFPIAVFAFGDGEEHLKKLHVRRQIVGVSVVIPTIIAVLVGLIL